MKDVFLWICTMPFILGFAVMMLIGIKDIVSSFKKDKSEIP